MQITHTIEQPWRGHLAMLQSQNSSDRTRALTLRGEIALLEDQMSQNAREISNIITSLARQAQLPEVKYALSPDSSTITAEVPDPPKE